MTNEQQQDQPTPAYLVEVTERECRYLYLPGTEVRHRNPELGDWRGMVVKDNGEHVNGGTYDPFVHIVWRQATTKSGKLPKPGWYAARAIVALWDTEEEEQDPYAAAHSRLMHLRDRLAEPNGGLPLCVYCLEYHAQALRCEDVTELIEADAAIVAAAR